MYYILADFISNFIWLKIKLLFLLLKQVVIQKYLETMIEIDIGLKNTKTINIPIDIVFEMTSQKNHKKK